jgi:ribosomal protein S18 acetylase RimI-like enzyme
MKYYLRQVLNDDGDFLYRLKSACLKEYVAAIWGWDEADQRCRFTASFDPADSQIVVVYGRDVGQLAVDTALEEVFLSGIYLLPAYQDQGLGSQVLSDLLSEARQRQLPVRLQVLAGNPARNLYERLGFRVIDRTDTHYIMCIDFSRPVTAVQD